MILEYCSYLLTRIFLTTCGVILIEVFGSTALAYQVLSVLLFINLALDFFCKTSQKRLSFERMKALGKDAIYCFCLVLASHQLVRLTGYVKWVEDGVVMYLAISLFVRILERAEMVGFPPPKWIKERLLNSIENGLQKN